MKILLVMGSYYPELQFGGSTQKLYELSLGLVERGHDVRVLTFHSDRSIPHPPAVVEGVRVEYLPWIGTGSWRIPRKLKALVESVKWSDVVHCFGLYNLLCPLTMLSANRARRPYVLEPMGMYAPRGRNVIMKRIYNFLFTRSMMASAKAVIATSQSEMTELKGAVPSERLQLRHDGIKVETFAACPDGQNFRESLGISQSEKVVLYLGRISRIKNLEQLIVAFKRAALPASRLVLVGPMDEPDYLARLKALIKTEDLSRLVQFTGPLYERDKLPALAAADLLVLPSEYESYGLAAAEGVAAGIPVLITDTCGIAPLLHGRAGLSVPVNVQSLAEGMRTLLEDAANGQKFTRDRQEVLQELTWDKPLTEVEHLYQRVNQNFKLTTGAPLSTSA
jgi:glycosyltransferase involved in cell wall biosynthesis